MALRTNGFGVAADSEWQVRIIGTAPGAAVGLGPGDHRGMGSRSDPVRDPPNSTTRMFDLRLCLGVVHARGALQRGGYGWPVRQRNLETVYWRVSSVRLPGVTPGATGTFRLRTAREALRFAAGDRAHDGTGRAALPHPRYAAPRSLPGPGHP